MSGISTKDVKTGGGLPKIIEPGEHILKINEVKLTSFDFMEADKGYFLTLEVETKPIDGFEGFLIDPENADGPRYAGQIGTVKTNRFFYKDGETKSGVKISRDMEILKQIKNMCIATDKVAWFDSIDGKYATIEEIVNAFNTEKPFKDLYLRFCIAGKEFEKKNNYIGHDLYLPKLRKGKVAFEAEDAATSKLLPFDEATHIYTLDAAGVAKFDGEGDIPDAGAAGAGAPPSDFEL